MRSIVLTGAAIAALSLSASVAFAQDHSGGPAGAPAGVEHGSAGSHAGASGLHGGSALPSHDEPGGTSGHISHSPGVAGTEARPVQHTGSASAPHDSLRHDEAGHHNAAAVAPEHEDAAGDRHERTGPAHGREVAHARLAPEQRTRFVDRIRRDHSAAVEHVDFALNVGVVVPGRYHYYPLPPDIVSFVPEYRGYYFLVADGDIIIIDPATHEIVDVIPEEG